MVDFSALFRAPKEAGASPAAPTPGQGSAPKATHVDKKRRRDEHGPAPHRGGTALPGMDHGAEGGEAATGAT